MTSEGLDAVVECSARTAPPLSPPSPRVLAVGEGSAGKGVRQWSSTPALGTGDNARTKTRLTCVATYTTATDALVNGSIELLRDVALCRTTGIMCAAWLQSVSTESDTIESDRPKMPLLIGYPYKHVIPLSMCYTTNPPGNNGLPCYTRCYSRRMTQELSSTATHCHVA